MATASTPPAILDKDAFTKKIELVALRVPAPACSVFLKQLKHHTLNLPRVKRVYNCDDDSKRLLLLNPSVRDVSDLPEEAQTLVQEHQATTEPYEFVQTYDDLGTDEVLKSILPPGVEVPGAYELAGHIAHLNLRPEVLPYKHIIGQVILDKNPAVRTVVNKVSNIENEFRTFPMELLAGDDDFNVELRESGARFRFNFKNVYWNSRLQGEHHRLVQSIPVGAVVCDMMAGVGPFAVPLAMRGCAVYANDLNPESFKYLEENARLNKCSRMVRAFNVDGREFVRKLRDDGIAYDHVIMNLPKTAVEFLDVFQGLYHGRDLPEKIPVINVYGFSDAPDPVDDMRLQASRYLGFELPPSSVQGHLVRDVSPKKMMVCMTFRVPVEVLQAEPSSGAEFMAKRPGEVETKEDEQEHETKRSRKL